MILDPPNPLKSSTFWYSFLHIPQVPRMLGRFSLLVVMQPEQRWTDLYLFNLQFEFVMESLLILFYPTPALVHFARRDSGLFKPRFVCPLDCNTFCIHYPPCWIQIFKEAKPRRHFDLIEDIDKGFLSQRLSLRPNFFTVSLQIFWFSVNDVSISSSQCRFISRLLYVIPIFYMRPWKLIIKLWLSLI